MQITINVEAVQLAPTLDEIINSMTIEDKRAMAAKLAFEYFKEKMKTEHYKSTYSYSDRETGAELLAKELANDIKLRLGTEIEKDEELKKKMGLILDEIKPNIKEFVQNTITSIIMDLVQNTFRSVTNIGMGQNKLNETLKKLTSQI